MNNLYYLLEHFSTAIKLPVLLFDKNKNIVHKFQNSLIPDFPKSYLKHINENGQKNAIYLYATQEKDSFSVIYLSDAKNHSCLMVQLT